MFMTYKPYWITNYLYQISYKRTSLAVQWLGLSISTAGGMGLIPGQGTKIPHACSEEGKIFKKLQEPRYFTYVP